MILSIRSHFNVSTFFRTTSIEHISYFYSVKMDLHDAVEKAYRERADARRCHELLLPFAPSDHQDIINPLVRAIVDPFILIEAREYIFSVLGETIGRDELFEEAMRERIPLTDLEDVAGTLSSYDIGTARDIAKERGDTRAQEEIVELCQEEDSRLPESRPGWVHRHPPDLTQSQVDGLEQALQDPDIDAETLLKHVMLSGETEGVDSAFINDLIISLKPLAKIDVKSFRVDGPVNGATGCGESGDIPHYMFWCKCLESDDLKRNCDTCGRTIKHVRHCIRMPIIGGRWKGIFCSFECMVESPPVEVRQTERLLMEAVHDQLYEIGIEDVAGETLTCISHPRSVSRITDEEDIIETK